jgi:hypothetical protein
MRPRDADRADTPGGRQSVSPGERNPGRMRAGRPGAARQASGGREAVGDTRGDEQKSGVVQASINRTLLTVTGRQRMSIHTEHCNTRRK